MSPSGYEVPSEVLPAISVSMTALPQSNDDMPAGPGPGMGPASPTGASLAPESDAPASPASSDTLPAPPAPALPVETAEPAVPAVLDAAPALPPVPGPPLAPVVSAVPAPPVVGPPVGVPELGPASFAPPQPASARTSQAVPIDRFIDRSSARTTSVRTSYFARRLSGPK